MKSEIEVIYTTPLPLPRIRILKILETYFLFWVVKIFWMSRPPPTLNDATCLYLQLTIAMYLSNFRYCFHLSLYFSTFFSKIKQKTKLIVPERSYNYTNLLCGGKSFLSFQHKTYSAITIFPVYAPGFHSL